MIAHKPGYSPRTAVPMLQDFGVAKAPDGPSGLRRALIKDGVQALVARAQLAMFPEPAAPALEPAGVA